MNEADGQIKELQETIVWQRARAERLEAALREVTDDLENYVRQEYHADNEEGVHPALAHRYERDMEPVRKARALTPEEES